MFGIKYEKALLILHDEIAITHNKFLDTIDVVNDTSNVEERNRWLKVAEEYHQRHVALCELKSRLYKELGA